MTASDRNDQLIKVARAIPDWLRQDLISKDSKVRAGAEETLAAMLAAALRG